MRTKQEILMELQEGLDTGILTESDIQPFIKTRPVLEDEPSKEPIDKPNKLSAVDVMFYIAGIVLFSTILSAIVQSWNDGNPFVHIILSAGIGSVLWLISYYLIRSSEQNDIRKGLINALLLTGSLLLTTGGYIIINEIVSGYEAVNFIPASVALIVLGGLHIGFDRLIKRKLVLLMGVLLGVASFPALLFGFLLDADVTTVDMWCFVLLLASGLLAFATRVVANMNPERLDIHNAFDSFSAFLALSTMYSASFGAYGVLWFCALIGGILGIFYLSILAQNKHLLGNGSVFLVLTVVTISFRYFSGFGVTFSLIIATFGLLGSAVVASTINKKYFKEPKKLPPPSSQQPNPEI